ncbi:MAG: FkbM family methyltransferase, partial [Prevotellaceae bacterium]|nr:FkbM family methyltransferase [Prevotellaceae bacterium]
MNIIQRNLKRLPAFYHRYGWKGIAFVCRQRWARKPLIRFDYPKAFRFPVYLRKGASDFPIFEEIWVYDCYDTAYGNAPQFIVDAGANIGLATVFYANRFPDAKIIAVEPEATNFALLKKNTASYPNVHLHQAGLWNKTANLKIEDNGYGEWGFMVREAPEGTPGTIQAISIPELMRQHQCEKIDILKIDIEGSEKELFESDYE